jgi:DNA-binding response OmpR family regulator
MARVLCVDDEPHAANLKCIILETAGHQATPATSAREAIALLESNSYDVVVTDWRLGDANGRDIVVAARKLADTPVVVISGYVNEAFQAADPLADYYLEKPVNPDELIGIVNDLANPGPPKN